MIFLPDLTPKDSARLSNCRLNFLAEFTSGVLDILDFLDFWIHISGRLVMFLLKISPAALFCVKLYHF